MHFAHSDERRMLAESLHRFLAEQHAFSGQGRMTLASIGCSRQTWRELAGLGVLSLLFDEAAGGLGGSGFDVMAIFEELGRGLVVEPVLGALMVGEALAAGGNASQRRCLQEIMEGGRITALAHDEPEAHYELARVETSARRRGDSWILNGTKSAIAQGEMADSFLVSARTGGAGDAQSGISLFLVPAHGAGARVRGCPAIDGGRVAELTLQDVVLGKEALVGAESEAYPILERAVGRGVLALCAEALGAMEAAKDATLNYLRTRQQFGRPIGSFQALQHRMADLLLEVEQARSAVINAAAVCGSEDRLARESAISAAKYSVGRIGTLVAEEAIQMHGGMGMTWELPVSHYAKRLVMIDHQLGDEDHHLQRYIALAQELKAADGAMS